MYPDFYSRNKRIVVDAKYKKLDASINREDLYQIISYSYILQSEATGVIYPTQYPTKHYKVGALKGYGASATRRKWI